MDLIVEAKSKGVNQRQMCELLQIEGRRVRNWFSRKTLVDAKPGPERAPHALLPEEKEAILAYAKDEAYVDDSHRILTAKCVDAGYFSVSASTVYRVMRNEGLTTDRCGGRARNGNSRKPDRPELTCANQRWCWDISYLRTAVSGTFLYLYALMDEYSRKVVAFRISWHLAQEEGKELVDEGIEKEGLTEEQIKKLELFNDRGAQMKAKSFKKFLESLGISQRFARPQTPNDNAFVESLFSTTKGAPGYPGFFTDDLDAIAYFTAYFDFYNNVRLHGRIGYVTPAQRHCGQDKIILAVRSERLTRARRERLLRNRQVSENVIEKMVPEKNWKENCLTGISA